MLRKVLKTLFVFVVAIVAAAWLLNFILAPKLVYSISSSVRSEDGARTLTVGDLNPYPLSRECYRYVFIHPSDMTLDARKIQWEYLVAQFTCDGTIAANWRSPAQAEVITRRIPNGSLPEALVEKAIDRSGLVGVVYSHGA
jgi:hypothetical protein